MTLQHRCRQLSTILPIAKHYVADGVNEPAYICWKEVKKSCQIADFLALCHMVQMTGWGNRDYTKNDNLNSFFYDDLPLDFFCLFACCFIKTIVETSHVTDCSPADLDF